MVAGLVRTTVSVVKLVDELVTDEVTVVEIVVKTVFRADVTVISVKKKSVSVERAIELIVVVVSVLKKFVVVVRVEKLVEITCVVVDVVVEVVRITKPTATCSGKLSFTGLQAVAPGVHKAPVHPVTIIV